VLEPPRVEPAEVAGRLAQIADATTRRRSALVAAFAVVFVGCVPLLMWMGIRDVRAVIGFGIVVAFNGLFALVIARRKKPATVVELHLGAVFNALVTAAIARMFSPFLVAPGIGAVSVLMFLSDPRVHAKIIIPLTISAVLGPWVLELAGVLAPTIGAESGNLVLHSSSVNVALPASAVALALYAATMIALSGLVAKQLGETVRASLRSVELQAWHLRQLVAR
jgi:eukaryotic-like serine/threonine-protein kinase